jgi:hypothetical protein
MKAFFGIIIVFAVLYMFYLPIAYIQYAREADAEFSALLLSKAADYAGEAAMAACIEVAHIETEYTDEHFMVMWPERALDAFAAVLCLSYDLPVTLWNIDTVKQKIPVMVLATNDGYYIAERRESGNGESSLMWGLKKPYAVDTDPANPNAGTMYGVELGMDLWRSVNKQALMYTEGRNYGALPFDRETMLQHINLAINRDVTAVLARHALENGGTTAQGFHLPVSANTIGVRRVERPSLIVILQDVDLDGRRPVDLSVVSGMMVEHRRMVIGWTDGAGNRFYCYSGQADETAQTWIMLNGVVFDTVEQAARAGYLPDPTAFR